MGVARVAPPWRAAFDTLAAMIPAILLGAASLVALVLAVMYVAKTLRKRGRAEIDRRFPAADVLLSETLAQSYGQQSRGATQARGNGALALTTCEHFFLLYVPERELRIPLSDITAVSHPRGHLGKTGGVKLLHVAFTTPDGEDAIAWRVPDPEAWKAKLDTLRA